MGHLEVKICQMVIAIVLLMAAGVAHGTIVKRHSDGSMSSNSGPSLVSWSLPLWRRSRSNFMIESKVNLVESRSLDDKEISKIVEEHNSYRRTLSATNMQKLSWDPTLAARAQKHANECTFEHSANRGNVGENIWVAQYADFSLAVRLWYEEVNDGKCGCKNAFKECCGHYTQLIWADTNKIGCGFAKCKSMINAPGHHYSLVCQYNPTGNLVYADNGRFVGLPAFKASNFMKSPCSECPMGSVCTDGLCDYK